ncbi:MAG: amidase [Pseudomonadota bacterium]
MANYQPDNPTGRPFHTVQPQFVSGESTPNEFLSRCIQTIEERESTVKAFVAFDLDRAKAGAEASTERYRRGQHLSPIDGMPVAIKDVIQTKDFPTTFGSPIYKDNRTGLDSASVDALRRAGAIIVGKTVTTEFAFVSPGPTTNPFDSERTPGGSSSGSAAAVGAGMVTAALGNQVVGSVIRPASYCANYAIKPTRGALHGGEGLSLSQLHLGVHAASLTDMWHVAFEIAQRAGADPGYPGLYGPGQVAPPTAPRSLIALETEGWVECDAKTRNTYQALLARIEAYGVRLLRREDWPQTEIFERTIANSLALCRLLCSYEMRWALRGYRETGLLSEDLAAWLVTADELTLDDYREALRQRDQMRSELTAIAPLADGMITLAATGPAPALDHIAVNPDALGTVFKTGSPTFNSATSALGCPAITVPVLAVDGLPLGVQVLAAPHQDWSLTAIAGWLARHSDPTS